jgi:hypothetical protein
MEGIENKHFNKIINYQFLIGGGGGIENKRFNKIINSSYFNAL